MVKRICLFTAHSPAGGGGSVILRSLITNLPEFSFSWKYLANSKHNDYPNGYLGQGIMNSGLVKAIYHTWVMLAGIRSKGISSIVKELLAVDCDAYWVVSHNEGLRVALELARIQQQRPVHLTVHDDWAGAICARSFRFRAFKGTANRLTVKTLTIVSSFDVISANMKAYYKDMCGIEGRVCHRYLPVNAIAPQAEGPAKDLDEISVGHIGSVYDKNDFIKFVSLLHNWSMANGKKTVIRMWGCHLKTQDIPHHLQPIVIFYKGLPEAEVIPMLRKCHFVYAMYPFANVLRTFTETSLPTKLTTYVEAGRPIFAHCPPRSSLRKFIQDTNTGIVWNGGNTSTGLEACTAILNINVPHGTWANVRNTYFGENNVHTMRQIFNQH